MAEEATTPPAQAPEDAKDAKKDAKVEDTATNIFIKVYSPYQIYYNEEADSISAENDTGPFDVLPRHHNFITLLNPCELSIRSGEQEKRIKITRGVMHVRSNKVTVFLDV